jgi:hypothetical protein
MAGLQVVRQDDFTGGLNLRADQFQLGPNESPRMLNVEIDPRGGVFSRGAMRRINTSGISAHWYPENMFAFYGDAHYVLLSTGRDNVTDGSVYWSNGSNFTDLAIPVGSEHGASFAAWGKTLYITAGRNKVSYKWDGTTKAALSESGLAGAWQNSYASPVLSPEYFPKAEHAITHAGKVFVANTIENGVNRFNRIRWSHPNNPTNWAEQDYIDINDGGQDITGLASYGGHLIVFKHNSVFAIFGYDSDTFQVVELSRNVGAATPHAVCTTERGVYFFSYPDGLMLYNGNNVVDVFEPIRPAIIAGHINAGAIDEVYVNYINRRIWVSVPYSETGTVSNPSVSFVYDPSVSQRGAWLMFSTGDSKGFAGGCTFILESGQTRHLAAHATLPYVLSVDEYANSYDNITGTEQQFTSRYRTRWMDAGSYSQKKMWRRPDIVIKQAQTNSTLRFDIYSDYEESTTTKTYSIDIPNAGSGMLWGVSKWGEAEWGASNFGSQIVNARSIGLARAIQVEFSGSVGAKWGINSLTMKYNPRKVTK